MNIYKRKFRWKVILLVSALLIAAISFLYTNTLATKLADEERKRVEVWAEAIEERATKPISEDVTFFNKIVDNNTTIPVILTDENYNVISEKNFDAARKKANSNYLKQEVEKLRTNQEPIEIEISEDSKNYIFYKNSILLNRLKYFPIIQLLTIAVFLGVSYLAFSSARKAEQNQVWVGMAKETAHQLGTPISSMLGWVEYLKAQEEDNPSGTKTSVSDELRKDVSRLELITERFSKIGSKPQLENVNMNSELEKTMNYVKRRASEKISFSLSSESGEESARISPPLFDWVVENLLKNALDSMDGTGTISIHLSEGSKYVKVDITDSGKGISKSSFNTVFQPGYSTKKRGWGLGLSLSKRIIENYHLGKIFVKSSTLGEGTTFRILLPK